MCVYAWYTIPVTPQVVSILQTWISGLQEASSIRGVLASASEILSQRAEPSARAAGPPANPQVGD
jgi:hypothetical protein